MDRGKEKTTAPYPPVGADGGQPLSQKPNQSIAEEQTEHKPQERDFREILRQIDRVNDPAYLPSLSMNELYDRVFPSKPPVVEGLLYPGVYLFVGAPKVGKSFLMAQLAYHVSMGLPLWGYEVRRGAVLYLALEDDYPRLQERLYRMFGADSAGGLFLSISAHTLGGGLEKQLEGFVQEHPDTRLIIIDTLQKIRETGDERYSYASDYEVITKLKRFADASGVCVLLVHHTRKQQADDRFDKISGTNGLMGAADGAFLLQKERRTDSAAMLDISGRDLQDQRLYLKKDEERLVWELERRETELHKEPPDPVLEAVAALVTAERPEWNGTATDLAAVLGLDIQPNALTKRLNVRAGKLLLDFHIGYTNTHIRTGSRIRLVWVEEV
ncbi:helicase RepA family protein [uncultured Oscillibacter sp.]|uniref:helicase RepA family protein n=1 Tax=uncultured Oscillibacter sp. TaxID=876091 RepID=UPI0025FA368A|nr:helicase RepA family protein [uncultured Oscillibacter sp.]